MKLNLAILVFMLPVLCLAGLRPANEPPRPPAAVDSRNAFVTLIIQSIWIIIVVVAFAMIVWWGVRMRRKR